MKRQFEASVLVVDDEADVLKVIGRSLSGRGFTCCTASNAEEALARSASDHPSLTIVDIRMPGRDGIWLLTELKNRWPEMAVVMLTGVDDARTAVECLKKGADDYLTKPIDLAELHIAVERVIEKMLLIRENDAHRLHLEREVTDRIERMVEHMTDGVLMLDERGEVVAMNAAARSILGVDAVSGQTMPLAELSRVLQFDPISVMNAERRVVRKGFVVGGIPYQALLSPVEEGEGEVGGVVLAFRNFSEETKIDEMKTGFIKTVSHEIRTPLTATKNAIALLSGPRLGELNPNQTRFLDVAKRNIEQLIGMVNDLLDVSKIEAGKMDFDLQPVDLAGVVNDSVSGLKPSAEEKGIVLEARVASDLPRIYGEVVALQRVLINLIGNALKFTEREGTVRVDASASWEGDGDARAPAVRVEISDTGIGIPAEQLESVFEKFHQVDDSRNEQVAGTGLGLTITRELVRAHHGRIWAESEAGQGSRFIFVLPVLNEEELFFRALTQEVDRAQRNSVPLALLVIRLANLEELIVRFGERHRPTLLGSMEAATERTTRRSSDRVLVRSELAELVVVLPDTPLAGGSAFATRLREAVKETLAATHGELQADFDLSCGVALFPEQAVTAESLYRLAADRVKTAVDLRT